MATSSCESDVEFRRKVEPLLEEKKLEKSDLQVQIKIEDVETVNVFIGRDWYSFGKAMDVDSHTLDEIKENNKTKNDKKAALLDYLINNKKVRYEGLIYGHYRQDPSNPFITSILDFLTDQRQIYQESLHRPPKNKPAPRKRKQNQPTRPWQASYKERVKDLPLPTTSSIKYDLSSDNYKKQFYDKLCLEEQEHMQKLKIKCDGHYYLVFYSDDSEVPEEVKEDVIRLQEYGYIYSSLFTDDKIEYATQTSEGVHIYDSNHSYICKAFIPSYNHQHLEQRLYVCLPYGTKRKFHGKPSHGSYIVDVEFEVKHSYFDHLQHSVVNLPSYVNNCLLPKTESFSELEMKFSPQWSTYHFMKLDSDKQLSALQMITSTPAHTDVTSCPPPVLLYGPFGSGKTRIFARAAYELMTNGLATGTPTRILICAHHPQSTNAFIDAYFLRIEELEKRKLPFRVLHISRYLGNPYTTSRNSHFYTTLDELETLEIKDNESLIIISSYTASLGLYDILNVPEYGFFTHLFLDEAAQVREPEAVTPLAMATRDAKIVLAGDDKQVGPRTLVLGAEAQSAGLDISLLERLMSHYESLGPFAQSYVTKLTMNYRSHELLLSLPELFYGPLTTSDSKSYWHHVGPVGYRFVCSDSRLVPDYIDKDQPLVEACIVLEQVLLYLKDVEKEEEGKTRKSKIRICVIASTRKQLNHIKKMASQYPRYQILKEKRVQFLPSFMIQGYEFQAIFLSLLEPLKTGDIKNYFTKSLFNPYVFNTVITRAKSLVVAVGKPKEILEFEDYNMSGSEMKCWHRYIQLCEERKTLQNLDQAEIKSNVLTRIKDAETIRSPSPEEEWPTLRELGATNMSISSSDVLVLPELQRLEDDMPNSSTEVRLLGTTKRSFSTSEVLEIAQLGAQDSENQSMNASLVSSVSSSFMPSRYSLQRTHSMGQTIDMKQDKEKFDKQSHSEVHRKIKILTKEKDDLKEKNKQLEVHKRDLEDRNSELQNEVNTHKKKARVAMRQLSHQSSRTSASDKSPDVDIKKNPFCLPDDVFEDDTSEVEKIHTTKKKSKKKTKSAIVNYVQTTSTQPTSGHSEVHKILTQEEDDLKEKNKQLEDNIKDLEDRNSELRNEVDTHKKKAGAAIRQLSHQSSRTSASDKSPDVDIKQNPFCTPDEVEDDTSEVEKVHATKKKSKKKTKSAIVNYVQTTSTQTTETNAIKELVNHPPDVQTTSSSSDVLVLPESQQLEDDMPNSLTEVRLLGTTKRSFSNSEVLEVAQLGATSQLDSEDQTINASLVSVSSSFMPSRYSLQRTHSLDRTIDMKQDKEKFDKQSHSEVHRLIKILTKEKDDLKEKNKQLEVDKKNLEDQVETHKKKASAAMRQLSHQSSRTGASDKSPDVDIKKNPFCLPDDAFEDDTSEVEKIHATKKKSKKKTKSAIVSYAPDVQTTSTQTTETNTMSELVVPKEHVSNLKVIVISMLFVLFIVVMSSLNVDQDFNDAPLPGIEVLATKRLTVTGGQHSHLHWDEFGLRIDIPYDALPSRSIAHVLVRVSVSGPYVYPDSKRWKPASAVYWITSSKTFVKPVLLGIWHNVRGNVNSSIIRVLTSQDMPQNQSYAFEKVSEFSINGSYIYLSLNHFSGYCASSTEDNFQGALLYRESPKGRNIWEYSFIVYKCFTKGVNSRLLSASDYDGWKYDLHNLDVVFESGSESIQLVLPQDGLISKNWTFIGRFAPLKYKKSQLQEIESSIKSNMVFVLRWKGEGSPTSFDLEYLTLPLKGAEQPTEITIFSNSIDDSGGNIVKGGKGGTISPQKGIISKLLEKSKKISDSQIFCIKLGVVNCENIERDYKTVEGQKSVALRRWLQQGEQTWKDFISVLAKMGDCVTARKLTSEFNVLFYGPEDEEVLEECPKINDTY